MGNQNFIQVNYLIKDNMKFFWILTITVFFSKHLYGQTLRKVSLNKEDKDSSVFLEFIHRASHSYGIVSLVLKKDSTYFYSANTFTKHELSEGKWTIKRELLVLESSIQIDNVPAAISNETNGKFVNNFDVAVVKNIKNELLTEAFVLINNDTIKCLPVIGQCNASFGKINRVKIVFENGMSSKWLNIMNDTRKIQLTVLTDIPIRNYVVMHKRTFKLKGDYLIQQ